MTTEDEEFRRIEAEIKRREDDDDDDTQEYVAQREWVGLTEEEIDDVSQHYTEAEGFRHGAEWANAKLKEKNT